jgi:death on curing protein
VSEPDWIAEDLVLAIHERQLVEVELAAKYTAGFVQDYPFIDGNKRTGFVVGVLFLELNGYRFTASEEAAAQAVLELAAGEIDESGFCEFMRAN